VVYMDNPILSEINDFQKFAVSHPYEPLFTCMIKKVADEKYNGKIPKVFGLCLPSRVFVVINSVDFLDDIFIN